MKYWYLIAVAVLLLPHPGRAADGDSALVSGLTLRAYLELVRTHHPEIAAAAAEVDMARGDLLEARSWSNPELEAEYIGAFSDIAGGRGEREWTFTAEQELPLAGQRRIRVRAAKAELEAAQREYEEALHDILHEAALAFLELAAAYQLQAVLSRELALFEDARRILVEHVESGFRSRYDLIRLNLERAAMHTRLESLKTENRKHVRGLLSPLGVSVQDFVPDVELSPLGVTGQAEALWLRAQRHQPELLSVQAHMSAADLAVKAAVRQRWPAPAIILGAERNDPGRDTAAVVGLGVEIPIFDRARGDVARARAGQAIATQKLLLTQRQLHHRVHESIYSLGRRSEVIRQFEAEALAHLDTTVDLAHQAYRAGQSDLIEFLDAAVLRSELREHHLELLLELWSTELNVLRSVGDLGEFLFR